MKAVILCLIIGTVLAANVYGLDQETKEELISIYNLTRDCYLIIVKLVDDLANSKIDTHLAEKKIIEWEKQYHGRTDRVPSEAQKMRDLMTEMIDLAQELTDGYQPNYQKTKDLLKELNEIKTDLKGEMTELRYILQ